MAVTVQLKHIHIVRSKGREYHYAWRGGPRLDGVKGSAEYTASYSAAHAARKAPVKGTFHEVIVRYRASADYQKLGAHTVRAYAKHLDALDAKWGTMPREALNEGEVRGEFIEWRDSMSATPRTADMAIGVLKTVLAWAYDHVLITANHAEKIKRLHRADKADAIWTADDVTAFLGKDADGKPHASKELTWAVELALHTGLRQSDLIRLAWNHQADNAFTVRTSKRGKFVTIPVTEACRALLARIDKRGPVVLTTHRGKLPWTADGLRSSFGKACTAAGVGRTFHDLRRTAATNLLSAGIDSSQVAMIMGWSEDDVEAMKRKYVSRAAVVAAVLAKLERAT